jgi:excisionase family DNA binding protein
MNKKRSANDVVPQTIPHCEILSVEEAARFLGISKLSMYKLIRDKKKRVPVKTIAGAFKISRRQLLDWFESL